MTDPALYAAAQVRLFNAKAAPLAYARLWHSERTSQRRALANVCGDGVFITILLGGNRCLAGETLIEDADTGERIRIDAIDRPITVWATAPDGARVRATAYPTARKGPDPLYTVTLSTGAAFTATRAHLVMGENLRWRPVAALRPGARLHGCGACRLPTTEDSGPSTRGGDDPRSTRTPPDSRSGCRRCLRSGGEPPPSAVGGAQGGPPSQGDAPAHSPPGAAGPVGASREGETPPKAGRSRQDPQCGPPSTPGDQPPGAAPAASPRSHASGRAPRSAGLSSGAGLLPIGGCDHQPQPILESDRSANPGPGSDAASLPPLQVVTVTYARTDYHYDLHVPGLANFIVDGVTHHNTGKSVAAAQWAVAQASGRDAWVKSAAGKRLFYVEAWALANGVPLDQIPEGPGRVWVASPTFAAAVEQIRPHLRKFAPDGTTYLRWDDKRSEAELRLPNGGVIVSKCYAQYDADPQTWEGANIRALVLDEQPNSRACLTAGLSRLVDQRGRVLWALTPLRGKSDWLYRQFINPQPGEEAAPPGFVVHVLHGADNPHIPQEWREMMLASVPAWQRASRDVGAFTSPEGAILPFDRALHVVQPFPIPRGWRRWIGVDWGARAPHVVWLAESPTGDLYVYRELWYRRATTEPAITDRALCEEVVRINKAQEPPGVPLIGVADSESPGAIVEASLCGLALAPAAKGPGSVVQGLTLMESLMATVDSVALTPIRPRLYFFATCPVVTGEVEDLKWAKIRPGADPHPDPSCSDHGPDALRYVLQFREAMGIR